MVDDADGEIGQARETFGEQAHGNCAHKRNSTPAKAKCNLTCNLRIIIFLDLSRNLFKMAERVGFEPTMGY